MDFEFIKFCEDYGIHRETSTPYTSQQNGIVEKKNRILTEMVNTMLISSGSCLNLWGEALFTACHILNRVPQKKLEITPYEI